MRAANRYLPGAQYPYGRHPTLVHSDEEFVSEGDYAGSNSKEEEEEDNDGHEGYHRAMSCCFI